MFTASEGPRARVAGSAGAGRPRKRACVLDSWYVALDQETAIVGGRQWTLHVMGIHAGRGRLWIQLQPAPDAAISLVLKVGRATRVEDALEALRAAEWPGGHGYIVNATRRLAALAALGSVGRPRALRRSMPAAR